MQERTSSLIGVLLAAVCLRATFLQAGDSIGCSRCLQQNKPKHVDGEIGSEEAARMMKLAVRTQETMSEYLKQATSRKIDRLSL